MNTQSRTTRIERGPMYNLERELKIRGFSRKTIKAYLHCNRKFSNFTRKSPKEILSKRAIGDLKIYLQKEKMKNPYAFPGAQNKDHLSKKSVQKIALQVAKLAGIKKDISCHSLRHSFAIYLLD